MFAKTKADPMEGAMLVDAIEAKSVSTIRPATAASLKAKAGKKDNGQDDVDVGLLLFFFAIAETLSFTKAARKLGIDQSWLSQKIRQLEASLGTNLFIRNTRNVELTSAGQMLLDPARRLANVASQARAATHMMRRSMTGSVRVGALPFSFPGAQRTQILDRFMATHPDVEVIIRNGPTPMLLDELRGGSLDLAYVSAPFDENGLDILTVRETPYCVFLEEEHPLAALPSITIDQLAGLRAVVPQPHFNLLAYEHYYQPLVDAGLIPVPVPEFQCSVIYAQQLGRIPVVCTEYTAAHYAEPGMTMRLIEGVPVCRKLLVRPTDHRTPSQVLLWDMIAESIAPRGRSRSKKARAPN